MNLHETAALWLTVTLILGVSAGCASTPKPVTCDGDLEPINKSTSQAKTAFPPAPSPSPDVLAQGPANSAVSKKP